MDNIENKYKDHIFHFTDLYTLKRHKKNNLTFRTLNYFCFFIPTSDLFLRIQGIEYKIVSNSMAFVKPYTQILILPSDEPSGRLYILAFSNSFYKKYSDEGLLQKLNYCLNFSCPIFILPFTAYLQEIIIKKLLLFKNTKSTLLYQQLFHNSIQAFLLEVLSNLPDNSFFKEN